MSTLNNLDAYSAKVCQISIFLGCGLYINQQFGIVETQIPYFAILAIINLFYLLLVLNQILQQKRKYFVIKSYWAELEGSFDNLKEKIILIAPWTMKYPFLRRYLENSNKRKKRIEDQYLKIKKYLLSYARPIKQLKGNLNSIENQIRPYINTSVMIQHIRIEKTIPKEI